MLLSVLLFLACNARAQVHKTTIDSVNYAVIVDSFLTDTTQSSAPKTSALKTTAVVVAGAGLWVGTFAWVDEPVQRYFYSHNSLVGDKLAAVVEPLGRQHYMLPLAAATAVTGMLMNDHKLEKAGIVAVGSIVVSAGVTEVLKHQFHRHRPNSGDDNHFFDGPSQSANHTSLPSSHTTTAFAVATAVASVYRYQHPIVPPVAYGIATLVGLSRINDNAHWTTDVLAGALVGYLSAKGTLYVYDSIYQKQKLRHHKLLIMPHAELTTGGVSALLIF